MPPPLKGKAPTKGAKQIMADNAATITFYRNMALGSTLFYGTVISVVYPDELSFWTIVLNVVTIGMHLGCYHMMKSMSRPRGGSEDSQYLDPGLDLNMEGGIGENIKDVVIVLSIMQVLVVLSSYFWLLFLLFPIRALNLLWVHVLGPWFFQEAPEDTEQDTKKRKKMERKMNRMQK